MQIVHVRMAKSIWLVDIRDLNPRGLSIYPMVAGIAERYKFKYFPLKAEDANPNRSEGMVFADGAFAIGNTLHRITKCAMYGDGFVVETGLSTDFSDDFLRDLLIFLSTQFALAYHPEMIHTRLNVSELIVRTDKD